MSKIMIVDDDAAIQEALKGYLAHMGYSVAGTADSGAGAVEMVREVKPDLILMDIVLPGEMDGISAAQKIKAESDIPIVFITGYGDREYVKKAQEIKPFGYVMKPFGQEEIGAVIEIALHKKAMELKLKKANEQLAQTNRDLKQEIKERKLTEEALRASEEQYRSLVESTEDAIFLVDRGGAYLFMNGKHLSRIGCQADKVIGKTYGDFHLTENSKEFVGKIEEVFETGETIQHEHKSHRDNKYFLRTLSPIKSSEGHTTSVTVVSKEISERKKAEEALRESEEKYSKLFHSNPQWLHISTLEDGRYDEVNEAVKGITGYEPDELIGRTSKELGLWADYEERTRLVKVAKEQGGFREQEATLIKKNGEHVSVLWSAATIEIMGTVYFINSVADISERKRAEEERELTLSQFRATLEATVDGIIVVGLDSETKVFSKRFKKIWHMPDSVLDSEDANQVLDYVLDQINEPEVFSQKVQAVFADPNSNTFDTLHLKDGRILEVYSRPQKLEDKLIGRVWAFRDVTKTKQAIMERQKAQSRLQALSDASFEAIFFSDQGVCIDQNSAAERMFGYSHKEAIGRNGAEWIVPEDREEVKNNMLAGYEKPYEVTGLRKDGSTFPAEIQGHMLNFLGKPTRVTALRDNSVQQQAREALRESENKYRTLIETIPHGIQEMDTSGIITFGNSGYHRMLGYDQGELEGRSAFDLIPDDSTRKELQDYVEILVKEQPSRTPWFGKSKKKDGNIIDVQTDWNYKRDKEGRVTGFISIITDISERVQAEEALQESEDFFTQMFVQSKTSTQLFDPDGNCIRVNPEFCNLFGVTEKDITSGYNVFNDQTAIDSGVIPLVRRIFDDKITNKWQINFDIETASVSTNTHSTRKGGIWIDVLGYPVLDRNGSLQYVVLQHYDITDTKLAQDELLLKDLVFETSITANSMSDKRGIITHVNNAFIRTWGYDNKEEAVGNGIADFLKFENETAKIIAALNETGKWEGEYTGLRKDGTTFSAYGLSTIIKDASGEVIGYQSAVLDISYQKKMQEELLKAKKLESVGVLAGGIAHDFNNLMSVVVGNISLARTEMRPGSKGLKNLVKAEKASIQTTALTSRLITFSKGGGPVKEPVSIGDLVKNSVDSSLKGSDISCIFSVPEDILPVEVDEEQMKQVIHNITTNAQEAMAEQGTINVSCGNVIIGEKDTLNLKDGKYVKISIEDQGPGIPKKDLINIFDPYFSTKEMGTQKGMGLGLAVSDSIVKKHDGLITVESKLGTGTTFSIYLPASEKEIVEATPVKKPAPGISESKGEKILVMDDEEVVRDVCNALLAYLGYEVEVAVDGVEAIELYKKAMESEKPFDMVILDLTNKIGMGGAETMVNLLEIDPDVKAIVASGYSNDPLMSNFREHGFRAALPKPFNLDKLKTALQDAIAGK